MKTIQFNANQILNGNNYPIAENMVIISTGHDDSIIDNPEGYQEYIIPILEAIQNCSLRNLLKTCIYYFYGHGLPRNTYLGIHY